MTPGVRTLRPIRNTGFEGGGEREDERIAPRCVCDCACAKEFLLGPPVITKLEECEEWELELGQDESLFGETAKKSSDEKRCNAPRLDCVAESCSCPSLRSLRIFYYYYHYLFGKDGYDGLFDPKKIKNQKYHTWLRLGCVGFLPVQVRYVHGADFVMAAGKP